MLYFTPFPTLDGGRRDLRVLGRECEPDRRAQSGEKDGQAAEGRGQEGRGGQEELPQTGVHTPARWARPDVVTPDLHFIPKLPTSHILTYGHTLLQCAPGDADSLRLLLLGEIMATADFEMVGKKGNT